MSTENAARRVSRGGAERRDAGAAAELIDEGVVVRGLAGGTETVGHGALLEDIATWRRLADARGMARQLGLFPTSPGAAVRLVGR